MSVFIPLINSSTDISIYRRYYSESKIVRISQGNRDIRLGSLKNKQIWFDPGIDIYDNWNQYVDDDFWNRFLKFDDKSIFTKRKYTGRISRNDIEEFLESILNKCPDLKPAWLSIPQLPLVNDNSRNKINKILAELTYEWKQNNRFGGKLILPLILTHKDQSCYARHRNRIIKNARDCFDRAQASGTWIVDSSLSDWSGSNMLNAKKIPNIIKLHEGLNEELPLDAITLAGPYWALNLILWARGLVDYPVIGLGRGYKYNLAGGFARRGSARIAIPPLLRWAKVSPELKHWLRKSIKVIKNNTEVYDQLNSLYRDFDIYEDSDVAREQVAKFYQEWISSIENIPSAGRALALYQNFSKAFVIGKSIRNNIVSEKQARRPEQVVKQFMFHCL